MKMEEKDQNPSETEVVKWKKKINDFISKFYEANRTFHPFFISKAV